MNPSDASPLLRNLFLLDPAVAFLNHGSFGATPRPVFEKYQEWQRELERQPVEFLGRRFAGLMQAARAALADFLGIQAGHLVFVPNATTGLNIIARSLRLGHGDEILTMDHEYGAIDRTWRFISRKTGASLRVQSIPLPVTGADAVVASIWAGMTPRTRVLSLSHITSPTGLILPVQELCRRARKAGILSIVDGAHAPGQLPLNLAEIGADFYSANAHKWLCAPKGSAFLFARPEVQSLLEPLVVSWGYEASVPGPSRFIDEQQWTGTRDIAAYLTVPAAIEFCTSHDWDNVRRHCHAMLVQARDRIASLTGLPHLCPNSPEWFMQMASLPLPPVDGPRLQAQLYEQYRVEVPVIEWQGRSLLRVSIQGYNTPRDVERLVAALRVLLPGPAASSAR
ncbi:MAG: aminotransferase class V-fold PLP-dependent enzyme [Opitutaceae bacterium]|nr:aminotransferase class V-fold PLP-dependent enzyme [Opitutaceae bacterium]